ncbi:MAG: M1 family metallopeptidase [Candidatus Polarisedimenticolia bacterium]
MKSRVNGLLSEKNEAGLPYKRGAWSKTFRKVDDRTYQGTLHVDTAMGTDLKSQRFLVTLTQNEAETWSISKEDLQDTYEGIHRGVLGDEACEKYESLSFDREGLTLKSGPGSLCKDFYLGKVSRIGVAAADLSYKYEPPVPKEQMMFGLLKRERAPDLVFEPEHAWFQCDPAACEELLSTIVKASAPTKEDQIEAPLRTSLEEGRKDAERGQKENPFWGFRRSPDPDRRFWTVALKRKGVGQHWFWMTHDSYDGREISVGASGFGPIYSYFSEETRASGADPSDLERRPDADARDYDLYSLKGTVEMGFGDGEQLAGDVTYGLTTKRPLRELPFAIARLREVEERKDTKNPRMFINSVQDGEGNELTWVRTGAYGGVVILPEQVPAGTKLTFRLQFENQDSVYKLTPSFSYVDRFGWLPFVRFSDMIHEFDLTLKVPARYKTLGIGKKVSETVVDGANVTRWVGDSPVTFPTVIFGQYNEAESGFKAKKKDGTEIPVRVHFDKDFMGEYEITPKALKKFADDAANALNLYREIFGIDYPYSKLDLVNDPQPSLYGQAPSSLIYLGSATFIGKGMLAGAFEGGSNLSKFVDSLVAHEVAHQWWGSLVANANFRNYWFVESLAEYSSALFTENVYGKKKYAEHVEAWRQEILENDMRSSVQDGYTVWAGPGGFGPYRAALYSKGPYAFHIMRATFGDEKFFPFLKSLATELGGKEIVTRDIQKVAEKSLGTNLDWFFDQWLRGVGLPEFTFDYKVREAEDGTIVVEGTIEQRILVKPGSAVKEVLPGQLFKGIVPITIVGKSGKEYRKKLIIEAAKTPFKFNIPEKPKEITLNKYGEALGYDVVVKSEL